MIYIINFAISVAAQVENRWGEFVSQ